MLLALTEGIWPISLVARCSLQFILKNSQKIGTHKESKCAPVVSSFHSQVFFSWKLDLLVLSRCPKTGWMRSSVVANETSWETHSAFLRRPVPILGLSSWDLRFWRASDMSVKRWCMYLCYKRELRSLLIGQGQNSQEKLRAVIWHTRTSTWWWLRKQPDICLQIAISAAANMALCKNCRTVKTFPKKRFSCHEKLLGFILWRALVVVNLRRACCHALLNDINWQSKVSRKRSAHSSFSRHRVNLPQEGD